MLKIRENIMATLNAFEKNASNQLALKGIKKLSIESLLWFEREVKKNISTSILSTTKKYGTEKATFQVGQLVLYKYDALYKDKLPVWDAMPLILVTRITDKGWFGVNLHYCPPRIRTWIMNALYENNTRKNILTRERVAYSARIAYSIAATIGSTKHINNSLKQYLVSQVRSVPVIISPEHWDMVVHLPLARFKKGKPY